MPTTQQLVRKGRKRKPRKPRRPTKALGGAPMLRGAVLSTKVLDPVKPNSADRKVCRVRLSNGEEVSAFIPGEGHMIREHSVVLVRGGATPDLRGFKYRVIRGPNDAGGVEREQRRSRYGVKRNYREKRK